MKNPTFFIICAAVALIEFASLFTFRVSSSPLESKRVWTDDQGQELIVGALNLARTAGVGPGKTPDHVYIIENQDAKSKPIPYARLSAADRAFVDDALASFFSRRDGNLSVVANEKKFAFIVASSSNLTSESSPDAAQDSSAAFKTDCVLNDAQLLKDRLVASGFLAKNVVLLSKDQAAPFIPSKENIERKFAEYLTKLDGSSLAFVYFIGHGVEIKSKAYFVPCDVETSSLSPSKLVSIDEVMKRLGKSKAAFRWLTIDACRNSSTRAQSDGDRSNNLSISKTPNTIVLLQSCRSGERSFEGGIGTASHITNGFFTLALCEALDVNSLADRNADGTLLFSELFNYVSTRASELAGVHYGKTQTPIVSGAVSDFTIATGLLVDDIDPRLWRKARQALDAAKWLRRQGDYHRALLMLEAACDLISDAKSDSKRLKEFEDERLAIEALYSAKLGDLPQTWRSAQAGDRRTIVVAGVEFAFRYCPPGDFMQGSPKEGPNGDEFPSNERQFHATLQHGFWIMETEVTQRQYRALFSTNPSKFLGPNRPIESITHEQARDIIRRLNRLNFAPEGWRFRLPTEGQWEYAARAGGTSLYPWGDSLNGTQANCNGTQPYVTDATGAYVGETRDVKSYPPNAWGIYDMIGNVSEWCGGCYDEYPASEYASLVGFNGGRTGSIKPHRGGNWDSPAKDCRCAARGRSDEFQERDPRIGVRLALWDQSRLEEETPENQDRE